MYKVKEVSQILNMSEHTIRYYTDLRLIPHLKRGNNKVRLFDEQSIDLLRGIQYLRSLNMTIEDIKSYIDLLQSDEINALSKRTALLEKTYQSSLIELDLAKRRSQYLKEKLERAKNIASKNAKDDKNPFTKKY